MRRDAAPRPSASDIADTNMAVYDQPAVVAQYEQSNGWINVGERSAVMHVASLVRGKRILDVGVGGGRTACLLSLLSDDYVGIDFTPGLMHACQRRYPALDIRWGDARSLEFGDGSFDFVFFSFNGIDTLDHEGRRAALSEMHRVLSPGGILAYSTLNRDGQSFGETPWQLHRPGRRANVTVRATLRLAWVTLRDPFRFFRRTKNWIAGRRHVRTGPDWSLAPLSAEDFCLVNHFVTLPGLRREMAEAAFDIVAVYESEAERDGVLPADALTSDADGFQMVARRRDEGTATESTPTTPE